MLLSYSIAQKRLLCEDIFSAQLYVVPENGENSTNKLITDGQETEGEHQHDLIVSEISLPGEKYNVITKNEILIECFGSKFELRKPYNSGKFYISYGFQYGRWFASTWLKHHNMERMVFGYNIGTSPQHVQMVEGQLEDQYWTTRKTIGKYFIFNIYIMLKLNSRRRTNSDFVC